MKIPSGGVVSNSAEGEKKVINSELWHACAGPLVSLPPVGSLVVYFPQGHSEQVAASMQKGAEGIPSYPNLPSKMICMLHNVTLHADPETDEVYAQMTLQPVNKYDQEALLLSDFALKHSRQPAEFFCKTLTASDTSTHGGFSVPRRAAEKIFPPLDFSLQPPAQELTSRDLHDQAWTFRHIYRGQPRRHLLTTGWSVFISSKRLVAGDAVLFIRDEKSQLLLGIKRANRQQPALSSSVISSDSMHIGVLAAAAHAAANNSPFTIFYNPRASPSEFVIPLAKYNKAMYAQISPGVRFRMMFETEESGVRRYMGTVNSVGDLDPVRWKNSLWRNLQVGWDESTAGERPTRVSIWEIEPVVTPFYICPPPFFRPKYPKQPGFPDDDTDIESLFKRGMPWIADDFGLKDASSSIFPGLSLVQWLSMQQNQQMFANNNQPVSLHPSMISSASLPTNLLNDDRSKLLNFQNPNLAASNPQSAKTNQQNLPQPSWPQQQQITQQVSQSSILNGQQLQNRQQPVSMNQNHPQNQPQVIHQSQPVPQQSVSFPSATNGVIPNHSTNHQLQQTPMYSQIQQPNDHSVNKAGFPISSMAQDMVFQRPLEQQQPNNLQKTLQQRPQIQQTTPQQSLSKQQLQLQLLQKLQQQQQQIPSSLNPVLEPQFLNNQQASLNQTKQNISLPPQQLNGGSFSASAAVLQPSQYHMNQLQCPQGSSTMINAHSGRADVNAPSCSTSSPKTSLQIPQNFLRNQIGATALPESSFIHLPPNMMQETYNKSDARIKHDTASFKAAEQPKFKSSLADQLDASSSATSYLDANGPQQNFPVYGIDGDVQSHSTRNDLPFMSGMDALTPDALLSRGYDSGQDIQNLLSNYNGDTRNTETNLSPGINSEAFGVPSMPFKPNDAATNETAVPNGGLWPNQGQRMRTYTKVQKRGSVGRTIDVTRYKGYEELRHDLACMFGIEGLLEDPRRTEWKLVYVDHENDILLVGDDPWEEFVSCVQSIKILSAAEVQQLSLDGDFCQPPVQNQNQACSETDSGNNPWRGHYDDNSATSFHR